MIKHTCFLQHYHNQFYSSLRRILNYKYNFEIPKCLDFRVKINSVLFAGIYYIYIINIQLLMETRTSMALSKVQLTNYSAISNLPRNVINQIKHEGEIYIEAPQKCYQIWHEMRRSDFTSGQQLSLKIVEHLFEKFREDFNQLLKLSNFRHFLDLFDQDNDGFLNEDEQILVFSVIKEKMSQVANQLLKIQEYALFKSLMKEVRNLEAQIADYQDQLRSKIYSREKQIYGEIGQEKLDDFYSQYYEQFQKLEEYKQYRRKQLSLQQKDETDILDEKLSKDTELAKVKPKKRLKDLQTQEKLVSLDERVEEALDFRRELKEMERNEQFRVQNEQQKRIQKQYDDLEKKSKKENEQLEIKLMEAEHKLIIQMKKDYDILFKQTNLYTNEIERIQGLATKNAMKTGRYEGELKRMKNRARLQNNIISETKESQQDDDQPQRLMAASTSPNNPSKFNKQASASEPSSQYGTNTIFQSSNAKTYQAMDSIKRIIKGNNITQFYIRKKYGAVNSGINYKKKDLPVNFSTDHHDRVPDNHERIEKILLAKKKSPLDILPSLTQLYNQELQLKEMKMVSKSEEEQLKERLRKRMFIDERLQNGDQTKRI